MEMEVAAFEETAPCSNEQVDWIGQFWDVDGASSEDFANNIEGGVAATSVCDDSGVIQMSIKNWISTMCSIPDRQYLEHAINLSCKLAELIYNQSIGQPDVASTLPIHLRDITSENIMILVDDENFEPRLGDTTSISSRALCRSLGEIFLEVFSRGRSCAMNMTQGGTQSEPVTVSNVKRVASETISSSKSSQGKKLLRDLGVPTSVCRLVCDLLDAENDGGEMTLGDDDDSMPLASLEEVFRDLTQMKNDPDHFLVDCTCPKKAAEHACIVENTVDGQLFGRDKEICDLMSAKNRVALHVNSKVVGKDSLLNAAFLSGYAGSGKSSLLRRVTHSCYAEEWLVLEFKFDKNIAPHISMANGFNSFFGRVSFAKVSGICGCIFSAMDTQMLGQLDELVPNFSKLFPLLQLGYTGESTSTEKVGAARKRLFAFFHILFGSMFAGRHPVLVTLDDMQLGTSFALEFLREFVFNFTNDTTLGSSKNVSRPGMFIVGTFRTNEIDDHGEISKTINYLEQCANVINLSIKELDENTIAELISTKLCLPRRYILKLSNVVMSKTRGNCFFIQKFIRAIIRNKMLEFSLKNRLWTWDTDTIEFQMISDGVAQFLTTAFGRLPPLLMHTLKIVSCLGTQIDEHTIALLESEPALFPFNKMNELDQAIQEGILEKAAFLYQFTHQILADSIYQLCEDKMRLHKLLGVTLLNGADGNSATHLLATDQLNKCKADSFSPGERLHYAKANVDAATFSVAASSFEQAQSYINRAMKLLEDRQWENYALSMKLYELSASVSSMCGDIATMSGSLNALVANAKTFEDSLTARSLFIKLYGATSKYGDAVNLSLEVLATLGEVFPQEISLEMVLNELSAMQSILETISVENIRVLPPMENKSKLHCMAFINLSIVNCILAKPMLSPLLSCRMLKLTMSYGFCEDSIVGIVSAGWFVFTILGETNLGYKLIKVGERLLSERKNSALSCRLFGYIGWLKSSVEPIQSVLCHFVDQYNSGVLAGDMECAMLSRWSYCAASFQAGVELGGLTGHLIKCIKQCSKYQQNAPLYGAMSNLHACASLSGENVVITEVQVKTHDELAQIAQTTKNGFLLYHNLISQMITNFYARHYKKTMELSDQIPHSPSKRVFDASICFYQGIASLCLARQTGEQELRNTGEKSLEKMIKLEKVSKWNYQHKRLLLQAELQYLNGQLKLAEDSYRAAISSAKESKFVHEEACSYELFGIFCLENKKMIEGKEQLDIAIDKYKQWGAMKKMAEVQQFKDLVDTSSSHWQMHGIVL